MPVCKYNGFSHNQRKATGVFIFMDYRRLYENLYGITIPPEYDIHHIDFNRDNNNIENLLLLPKDLHQRLHHCFLQNGGINTNDLFHFSVCSNQLWCSLLRDALIEAAEIYNDLQYWASCREMELLRLKNNNGPMYFSYNRFRK